MRKIEETAAFRRDYKREAMGRHRSALLLAFAEIVPILAQDGTLEARHRDHPLVGNWQDHRECHIKPDLLLINRKPHETRFEPFRHGSHSELGL